MPLKGHDMHGKVLFEGDRVTLPPSRMVRTIERFSVGGLGTIVHFIDGGSVLDRCTVKVEDAKGGKNTR